MKVLFIQNGMHAKNLNALRKYNICITEIYQTNLDNIQLEQFEVIYSPGCPIDVSKYPNSKFLFGPHFSVFPNKSQIDIISKSKNVIYIQPSEWVQQLWLNNPICKDVRIESLPFGIDTEKFNEIKPIENKNKVFLYHKSRHPNELSILVNFFKQINIDVHIFSYTSRYNEEEYIHYLQNSKFGIWLGRHESQGFALEEALACNVPLLVWNVTSMNQEYGYNYTDIPATCIPYWDYRCGESFTNLNELPSIYEKFINNLNNYKPREYILQNISIKKCEEKFIELVNNI
jgi:hypothetical protein